MKWTQVFREFKRSVSGTPRQILEVSKAYLLKFVVGKSFFNRRFVLFLFLFSIILMGLMGVFVEMNHAFVPQPSNPMLSVNTPNSSTQPLAENSIPAPQTPSYIPATAADQINLQKLRCKSIRVLSQKIQKGENYWTIAKHNQIDLYTLIGANPDLPFKAKINQVVNVLSQRGVLHTVRKDDTLEKISEEYDVDEKTIASLNGLTWWHGMETGDVLFLPGARPILMMPQWHDYYTHRGIFGDPLGRWSSVTSPFGPRMDPYTHKKGFHYGVDLRAKYGDPVYSAGVGKVIFAGLDRGYGNLIIIKHAKGYSTRYAHLSKIYVHIGQKVRRGSLIGRVGATGWATGPHLHFEVRRDGKAYNPLLFI